MIAGCRPFYKYVTSTTAIDMLESGQARYSTPLLFNDPFDTQSGLHFDFDTATLHDAVVDRIVELASSSTEPEVDKNDVWGKVVLEVRRNYKKTGFNKERWMQLTHQSFAALLETIHKTRNDYERHWQEVQLPQMRVFCVSEDKDNLLMWAHYAQDHKGAVFELWSLPDEDNHLSVATPVDYSDDPIPFFTKKEWVDDLVGLKRLDITSLYKRYACTKSKNWAYEREWRVWYPLSKTDKYDFSPIRQSELKAVYLGCQAEASFKSDILRLIANRYPETRVFQAKKKINAYALKYTDVI